MTPPWRLGVVCAAGWVCSFLVAGTVSGVRAERATAAAWSSGSSWSVHVIDDAALGADGVRATDFDGDGRVDLVTPWEEAGEVRLCFHPGLLGVRERWRCGVIGRMGSPEDALPFDFGGAAGRGVVVASEGQTRTVFALRRPAGTDPRRFEVWQAEPFPATADRSDWLVAESVDLNRDGTPELVVGGRVPGGQIAWLHPVGDADRLENWRLETLAVAGWVMSIEPWPTRDQVGSKLLVSDREGDHAGIWIIRLEPSGDRPRVFPERVAGQDETPFFLDLHRLPGDRGLLFAAAVPPRSVLLAYWAGRVRRTERILLPPNVGTPKAVRIADLDGDGTLDLVVSCENAENPRRGVFWMRRKGQRWHAQDISGPRGAKFDRLELLDLDEDGDLDVVTTEETRLGLVWFENPSK